MRLTDTRTLGLAGIAFLAGLALAALLFFEGSPISVAAASPLAIEVTNVGTHDATVVIAVNYAQGGGVRDWTLELAANTTARRELDDPPQEDLAVRVVVDWTGSLDGGRGEATRIVDPGACGPGETMVAEFRVDTTVGVAFRRSSSACL